MKETARTEHPDAARIRELAAAHRKTHTRAEFSKLLADNGIAVSSQRMGRIVGLPFKKVGYDWTREQDWMIRTLIQDNAVRGPRNVHSIVAEDLEKPPTPKQINSRVVRARRLGLKRLRVGEPAPGWMRPREARKQMLPRAMDLRKEVEGVLGPAQFNRLLRYRGIVLSKDGVESVMKNYPAPREVKPALDLVLPQEKHSTVKGSVLAYGNRYTDLEIWSVLPDRFEFTSEVVAEIRQSTGIELIKSKPIRMAKRKAEPLPALLVA